jgi:hypothetical protein
MRMKLLLENFQKFANLTEEQLIVEGRIDDARRKYPDLAKPQQELEGESLLQLLIDADPSGNQKYLMGAAKIADKQVKDNIKQGYKPIAGKFFPDDAPEDAFSPWGVVKNIADMIPKYHNIMNFIRDEDAKFKDINAISDYGLFQGVVKRATDRKAKKEADKAREEQTKKTAVEGTEFVLDTPYHKVVRPLTKEGSCYFGRQTRWCISAERSRNYFDQYTSDGKAFLFLLAKGKDVDADYKKIAVVMDGDGDFEEYFDAPDDSMTQQHFTDAIRHTMLGKDISGEFVSYEEDEPYDAKKILQGVEMLDLGYLLDDPDDLATAVQVVNEKVEEYIEELQDAGKQSVEDTPAGTPFEAYEKKLNEYEFDNFYVTLFDPSETGLNYVYWEASAGVDVEMVVQNYENWTWKPEVEDNPEEYEDEIQSAIGDALYNANIYPDDGEAGWGNPMEYNFRINAGDGYGQSFDLDSFDNWLETLRVADDDLNRAFPNELIEELADKELIEDKEALKRQAEEDKAAELARMKAEKEKEYFPSPEDKERQMKLPLQERRFRIKITKNLR